jgi:signal transduction histidine kinase
MMIRLKERALPVAVIAATVGVIVFTVVEYRWSTEVIEATGVRLADTLQLSMANWQVDFERNFSEVTTTLRPEPGPATPERLAVLEGRLSEWRRSARYPNLVSAIRVEAADAAGTPGWRFEPRRPALLFTLSPESQLVVSIGKPVIVREIMPDLARRYFQGTDGLDYEVAVTTARDPREVIYTSDPGFGDREVTDADGTLNIFARSISADTPASLTVFHRTSNRHESVAAVAIAWFPLPADVSQADDWRLVVRHRRGGPLGAFVADMHRRDLVISFGALLLLLLSIVLLMVTSSRAQRLARLQMDFVTAVSHELRTPLTVISSAADNISQGVVQNGAQVRQYGAVIRSQAGQLSALVEEILQFAATRTRPPRLNVTPLSVPEIVSATLAGNEELIRAAQFTVERRVAPNLPPAMGDPVAVLQVLQNLISNALRYGREGRWLGIAAALVEHAPGEREVRISVSNRGRDISAEDLPHIFEPFYRGAWATSSQIHGTGLGLTLAKQMAEAMHGDLTVESEPGRGSTFTLHLRCAELTTREPHLELSVSPPQQG